MTVYRYYIGGMGPYLYDDEVDLLDSEAEFSGETQSGFFTNGPIRTTFVPANDGNVLRFDEIGTMVVGSKKVTETFTGTGIIDYLSNIIYAEGTFDLFLPTLANGEKRVYDIKNVGEGIITLKPNTSELSVEIEGEVSQLMYEGDSFTVISDTNEWWVT